MEGAVFLVDSFRGYEMRLLSHSAPDASVSMGKSVHWKSALSGAYTKYCEIDCMSKNYCPIVLLRGSAAIDD